MFRSSRTIRSPSTTTLKLTGSLRAGCCGPIVISTSGIRLASPRLRLPVLPERVLPLRPVLVEHEAPRVRVSLELDAEEVADFPFVQVRGREEVRDGRDLRARPRERRVDGDDAATAAHVVHHLDRVPRVEPVDRAQVAASELVPEDTDDLLRRLRDDVEDEPAGPRAGRVRHEGAEPRLDSREQLLVLVHAGTSFRRQSFPPRFASSSMRPSTATTPSMISSGRGGHPAIHASTGMILSTP